MKRYWNYRILANIVKDDIILGIYEVHYENDVPILHTLKPIAIIGENLRDIKWSLKKIQEASNKPILWGDNRFPQEVK